MKNILILIIEMFLLVLPLSFAVDPADDASFVWHFDELSGTVASEEIVGGDVPDGTANTASWVTGQSAGCGNGYDFANANYIGIDTLTNTGTDSQTFSEAFWFKMNDNTVVEQRFISHGGDRFRIGYSLGGGDDVITLSGHNMGILNTAFKPVNGVWYHLALTVDTPNSLQNIYINGKLNATSAFGSSIGYVGSRCLVFGTASDDCSSFAGPKADVVMDEISIYLDYNLTQEDVLTLYNSNSCIPHPYSPPVAPPPAITSFALTGTDTYDGSALENITVFITNSSFSFSQSTSNGTIILLNSSFTFNSTYDIKFASNQSGGYFNHSFNSINITEKGSFQGDLFQSRVIVNAKEVITNNTILSFTASVPLQTNSSNSTGQSVLLLKAGSYDLIGDAAGYMLRGFNFTVNPKQEINVNITLGTANLTVTALSSAGVINYFNTTITLLSTGFSETIETNTGTAVFPAIPGFFNVSINPADWTFDHKTITITTEDTLPNITFNLFSKNSINITIFDEETNEIIDYTTTTLIMDHISQKFTNTTGSGNVFFIELFDGLWDLLISTALHNQREYIFTIVPQTTSRLNVYLLNSSNGDLTTFNIKNKEDQTLPGSTISVSNKINNTFVTVAQSVSDFAGQSNIFLSSTNEYRFTIEADTFTTKIFDLVPLANAYDIIMDPIDALDFTTIYDVLSYTMIPASILTPQQEQNISFITSSPLGYISYFGLNSSFNSTTNRITNVSGSLAGGTASIFINTTDHTGTHIPVDFFIKIAGEPEIRIHHSYRTSLFITPGNISSVSIADKYKDSFTNVGKSLIIVIGAVAVILSLAEAGAPALANGIAGAIVIIFGVIIGWISPAVGIIITFITVTMVIFRRAD